MAINATINIKPVSMSGLIPTYAATIVVAPVSMSAAIYLQVFQATVPTVTMSADATMSTSLVGTLVAVPKITSTGDTYTISKVNGLATVPIVKSLGTAYRANSIDGVGLINRHSRLVASLEVASTNNGLATINLVAANYGLYGTGSVLNPNVALNRTIVLNLRTKSHCEFDSATNDAYATTGELTFGGVKNKNVSDAFIFGRSDDALTFSAWNDETTKRNYTVNYEQHEQANLKNKKVKLAKGLTGTNWQFRFANTNENFAEVRQVDLFVNELKRHV